MKNIIEELYGLNIKVLIKINKSVYRIKTDEKDYILKYVDGLEVESVYARLSMLNVTNFSLPIRNIHNRFISTFEDKYFELSEYYDDESILAKDIRLKYFLSKLALLHNKSQYFMKINEGFYEESYDFIVSLLDEAKKKLDDYLFKIEALDYKSPSQWLLLLNNQLFLKTIDDARLHAEKFKELAKGKGQLRVSLVYQNFDYSHILVKSDKIIGTQKITIAPPIYDLKYLFDYSFVGAIDITGFIQEYLNNFELLDYEKEWLLALLFIPNFNFKVLDTYNEVDAIVSITKSIQHFHNAIELSSLLTQDETKE